MAGIGGSGRVARASPRHQNQTDDAQQPRWPSLERATKRCTFFVLECRERLGYDDRTSPPSLGNSHRYSATRLAFPRLSCGSQPTTPHPLQAARNRANLLPRIWFQASRDLHEGLDTGPFLPARATPITHRLQRRCRAAQRDLHGMVLLRGEMVKPIFIIVG